MSDDRYIDKLTMSRSALNALVKSVRARGRHSIRRRFSRNPHVRHEPTRVVWWLVSAK
jgi:hypothetical protein